MVANPSNPLFDADGGRQPSVLIRLRCADTWAGNDRTASLVELPGLSAWVHSIPAGLDSVHYATMVAVGWHGRRGLLVMTNAGHPPPLWYHAARQEWSWLETKTSERQRPAGVPLGLLDDAIYDHTIVRPQPGDLVVLYSDGASEALNPAGDELGRDGLLTLASALDVSSVEPFGTQLTTALQAFRGGGVPVDDQTIIVLRRSDA